MKKTKRKVNLDLEIRKLSKELIKGEDFNMDCGGGNSCGSSEEWD